MKSVLAGLAALAVALTPNVATAQDDHALRLAPSMPWSVDYGEQSCGARRTFGTDDHKIYLELRQYAPGGEFVTTLASDDFRRRSRANRMAVTYLPDTEPARDLDPILIDTEGFGEGLMFNTTLLNADQRARLVALGEGADPSQVVNAEIMDAREAAVEGIALDGLFTEDVVLDTGSLKPVMSVMRDCLDGLVTYWGFDPEQQRNLSEPVKPRGIEEWARELQRRYPGTQLRKGAQAYVRVRMNVDAAGGPTACAVQSDFNDTTFNTLACNLLMEHARFEPARDAQGNAVASFWTTAIRYKIA